MTPAFRPGLQRLAALLALLALLATAPAPLLAQRDPTRPPEIVGAPAASASGAAVAAANGPRQLMIVDGRRYVVDGARLRGVGDKIGEARIERIEDAAVIVRDAAGVHRLSLHTGVVKRPTSQARLAAPNSR